MRLTITCGKSTFPTCLMTSNIGLWTIWKRKHQERNLFRHPKIFTKSLFLGLKALRYQFEAGFSGNVHFGYGNFNFSLLVSDKKVLIYGSFLPSCFNFLIALINLLTCFCLFASRFSLSFQLWSVIFLLSSSVFASAFYFKTDLMFRTEPTIKNS